MRERDKHAADEQAVEMDLARIRQRWQPALDAVCQRFDAPMAEHCRLLGQQVMQFQKEKAAALADAVRAEGEDQAHRALAATLDYALPRSLLQLTVLVAADNVPVVEPTCTWPSLPWRSTSATHASETSRASPSSSTPLFLEPTPWTVRWL